MKTLIGIVLVILGIALGLWLGLWVMFVGGIVQLVNSIKMTPISAMGIALGILRIMLSGAVGWLTFIICGSIGSALLDD